MTNIITRYFESTDQARACRQELIYRQRFPRGIVLLFDEAEGLADKLSAADVDADAAAAYQDRVANGGAVMMIKHGYQPLGGTKIARKVMADMGAADMGGITEQVFVKDSIKAMRSSVLAGGPHFLTRQRDPLSNTYHMADWPIPLISRRKPFTGSIIPPHAKMAEIEPYLPLPIPFADRKPFDEFPFFNRHARMANIILPLTNRRQPKDRFAFPRHARMANFPLPLISRRKPKDRFIFPRHRRMANWPFPHLINGETGTNALMPGAPRMANFPIRLISQRKPKDRFAFPRHARMANFPLPLISKRTPKDRFAFPRHARMADMFLPLVVRREELPADAQGRWSVSRMLGLSTVIRR